MTYTELAQRLADIRSLSINELAQRQPMLVALVAEIVNEETMNGEITAENSNNALEYMSYWLTLNEKLADADFERLGNGHFSAAYCHPLLPGKVIKVGFKKEDSGAAYAAFCRMNQHMEGIPTIHDIQRHAGCYTVVLDELEPLADWCRGESDKVRHHYELAKTIIDIGSKAGAAGLMNKYPLSPRFEETCWAIRTFFNGIASFDMHSGNLMKNKAGDLIITDPVSFSDDKLKDDKFHCDAEELLAEIEALKASELIERCKMRKAKRDRFGTFRRNLRLKAKAKQRHKVRARKNEAEFAKMHLESKQAHRDEKLAQRVLGSADWANMLVCNRNSLVAAVERNIAIKARNADFQKIAVDMNMPLGIDIFLHNAFFMG